MLAGGASVIVPLKIRIQQQLLTVAAVVETLAGLALILMPDAMLPLLLGGRPDDVGLMVGRLLGVGMLALGVACWGARNDSGGATLAGTVMAITLYNAAAGVLLAVFAVTGQASGLVVWIVGLFHLALAAGFLASQSRLATNSASNSRP